MEDSVVVVVRIDGKLLRHSGVFVFDSFQTLGLVSFSLQESLFSFLVGAFAVFEPIFLLFLLDMVVFFDSLVIGCLEGESALSFVHGSLLLLLDNSLLLPLILLLDVCFFQVLNSLLMLFDVLVLSESIPQLPLFGDLILSES